MTSTLVIGATGYLGRHVVDQLRHQGHQVRALVRDRVRAERPGPWGAPSLEGLVDDWTVGDVTDPGMVTGLAEGIEQVISCLGVTTQKADAWNVDYGANLAVLREAERANSRAFCYVNVLNGRDCPARLTRAKAAFSEALAESSLTPQIIDPPAYFSDMMQVFQMVSRSRRMWAFSPVDGHRINPIHGADLAGALVERVEAGNAGRWEIGGPDTFTWGELGRLASQVLGLPPKVSGISPAFLPPVLWVAERVSPHRADMLRFLSWNMTHDAMGAPTGTHHLVDFWAEYADRT